MPRHNSDLSNSVSSVINLDVYLSDLKLNHGIDILAEISGRHLIRAVVHDILPGDILDKYQTLTGTEYPSLEQYVSKAQEVAKRISQRQKNKQKDVNANNSNVPSQNLDDSINSTDPAMLPFQQLIISFLQSRKNMYVLCMSGSIV